jgi:hypothetical protein
MNIITTVNLSDWERRIRVIDTHIRVLQQERSELNAKIREARSPIKPGDYITWTRGKSGGHGRVVELAGVHDYPQFRVRYIRSDGSDGKLCTVYQFQKPKLKYTMPPH